MKKLFILFGILISVSAFAQTKTGPRPPGSGTGGSGSSSGEACCTGAPHCASISTQAACSMEGCSWRCNPTPPKPDPCKSTGGQWCYNPANPPLPNGQSHECVWVINHNPPLAAPAQPGSSCQTPAGAGNLMGGCWFTNPTSSSVNSTLCYKNLVY